MLLRIVALYPVALSQLEKQPGVLLRRRRDSVWTQIECDAVPVDGNTVARPRHAVPAGTPAPTFRAQIEWSGINPEVEPSVALVVLPEEDSRQADPEQRVLAPLFNNGRRVLFEFQRGEVVFTSRNGEVEIRLIAVDRTSGQLGTETKYRFHRRYMKLVGRCADHLNGLTNLFPPQVRSDPASVPVPAGPVDLTFTADVGCAQQPAEIHGGGRTDW